MSFNVEGLASTSAGVSPDAGVSDATELSATAGASLEPGASVAGPSTTITSPTSGSLVTGASSRDAGGSIASLFSLDAGFSDAGSSTTMSFATRGSPSAGNTVCSAGAGVAVSCSVGVVGTRGGEARVRKGGAAGAATSSAGTVWSIG